MNPKDKMDAYRAARNALAADRRELVARAIEARKSEFEKAGGCDKCQGRGTIVVWDTMDFMDGSGAEFGKCPKCDGTGPFNHGHHSKHDRYIKGAAGTQDIYHGDDCRGSRNESMRQLEEMLSMYEAYAHDEASPRKGSKVVAVKSYKPRGKNRDGSTRRGLEVGQVGIVFWDDGTRLGMRLEGEDENADPIWVAVEKVEVMA